MYEYTDTKLIHPPAKDSHFFALKPPRSGPPEAARRSRRPPVGGPPQAKIKEKHHKKCRILMHFDTPIPRITLFPIYPQAISRYPLLGVHTPCLGNYCHKTGYIR